MINIAKRYTRNQDDLLDFIAEGNMGLLTAVRKFDPETGYRFSTYGQWWIRQAIERYRSNSTSTIKVPSYMGEFRKEHDLVTAKFFAQHQRPPSRDEIRELLALIIEKRLSNKQFDAVYSRQSCTPFSQMGTPGRNGDVVIELPYEDRREVRSSTSLEAKQRLQLLAGFLSVMSPRDSLLLQRRGESVSLKKIGIELALSKERVLQIEDKLHALGRLVEQLSGVLLEDRAYAIGILSVNQRHRILPLLSADGVLIGCTVPDFLESPKGSIDNVPFIEPLQS